MGSALCREEEAKNNSGRSVTCLCTQGDTATRKAAGGASVLSQQCFDSVNCFMLRMILFAAGQAADSSTTLEASPTGGCCIPSSPLPSSLVVPPTGACWGRVGGPGIAVSGRSECLCIAALMCLAPPPEKGKESSSELSRPISWEV